jgi:CDP-4-dehydro-6-deoxyglucose reductase, E1
MKVNYAGPFFGEEEYESALETLKDGWLVMGKKCLEFEKKFPNFMGKNNGILTNSGSSANLLMLSTLKSRNFEKRLKDGDKVITPVSGFPTTVNPILQTNLSPEFCDIELETLNIDVSTIKDNKAKAMIFAHVLGNPANMEEVISYCGKDILLLEDCCDALISEYKGKLLGSFGEMSSCSFYPAHHITGGEGGFVSTNNPNAYKILKSLRGWGGDCYCCGKVRDTVKGACGTRFSNWIEAFPEHKFDHRYIYSEIGYNLKPIEIQGAFLLEQIKKIDEIKRLRNENWSRLEKIFKKYEEFFIVHHPREGSDPNWFAFPTTIRDRKVFTRFDFCQELENNSIQTRPYFAGNLLLQPAYKNVTDLTTEERMKNFPVASRVMLDTFFLGVSPTIKSEQIDYIEGIIDQAILKLTK